MSAFVHHNTLHVFEDQPFEQAVVEGGKIFDCEPYMTEDRYQQEFRRGRITEQDIEAVLIDDLGDEADRLVTTLGTRYALRMAMLRNPLRTAPALELRWLMTETDALDRFRDDIDQAARRKMITQTRHWILNDLASDPAVREDLGGNRGVLNQVYKEFQGQDPSRWETKNWTPAKWESLVLRFLWSVCRSGVSRSDPPPTPPVNSGRHRDHLFQETGIDCDEMVQEIMLRFCSTFMDQGLATWETPDRELGFLTTFATLFTQPAIARPTWTKTLTDELQELKRGQVDPLELIQSTLTTLGVDEADQFEYLRQTLLSLRGWAGMVWQLEFNAPWAPKPAAKGTFYEFLATKLLLDMYAAKYIAETELGILELADIRKSIVLDNCDPNHQTIDQRAFTLFQLAQSRFWNPEQLLSLGSEQWSHLTSEVELFDAIQRRRILHLAYERQYRNETLDAVIAHVTRPEAQALKPDSQPDQPAYQVVCCIDEREESFRRHLEEYDPECETFGVAGFFGVAMYYKAETDAHYTPLCPVNITPTHFVQEEPAYSLAEHSRRQAAQRRTIGRATHHVHMGTRTMLGGLLTGIFGSLAAFPLVARILFPRTTAKMRSTFGSIVQPAVTQLRLERVDETPSDSNGGLGYSIPEMVDIVEGGLRLLGLTRHFSKLVVISGHGSASLNNPHEAAHDCGACGGGRGGPNARAFAQMANDPRVRRLLIKRDLPLPEDLVFVGGYHNTCDDSMAWYDLDRLPATHRRIFERARDSIYVARERNAHERSRRFESADLSLSTEAALAHVEGRAEDLSQPRPEYGHATNALCFVGRRQWNRGLFLDRRAFLTSYDSTQDDERSGILERLLQAVIPVCAGINLEYYFSYVDPIGYGCGTKLPHNITSLLGVMDGAASDLRTGLPWQMVEIHEPVRLLFVIETHVAAMQRIIDENPPIKKLVGGGWVQLSVIDPDSGETQLFHKGKFVPYTPENKEIARAETSSDWYGGHREHLPLASINQGSSCVTTTAAETNPGVAS